MSEELPEGAHSLRSVQAMLGLSRRTIEGLIELGFVKPARGARNAWRFSFRDIVLLRTAHELQAAHISSRKILRALARLKATLPEEMPLAGLRISAVGDTIAVREANAPSRWAAESGQMLIDFEVGASPGSVFAFRSTQADPPPGAAAEAEPGPRDARALFLLGEALESTDAEAAEQAYRDALAADPHLRDAYLNLGAMWCEAGRAGEAASLYEQAVSHCPDEPLLHYNRAVALEDAGDDQAAIASYEASLRLDPRLADAHHNVAALYDRLGKPQAALRHFSALRRLQR
ncbi:Tetratricopeptide repeat-containing protein [Burkholderiales bacterium 8X]|nr:Tetratricopeptide repeat-containing protein [Burkholderiales bacterium 8X]